MQKTANERAELKLGDIRTIRTYPVCSAPGTGGVREGGWYLTYELKRSRCQRAGLSRRWSTETSYATLACWYCPRPHLCYGCILCPEVIVNISVTSCSCHQHLKESGTYVERTTPYQAPQQDEGWVDDLHVEHVTQASTADTQEHAPYHRKFADEQQAPLQLCAFYPPRRAQTDHEHHDHDDHIMAGVSNTSSPTRRPDVILNPLPPSSFRKE